MKHVIYICTAIAMFSSGAVHAAETITYGYDAKGRLIKVQRSGTVNNGVQTTYVYDKAHNRKNLTTAGSPNAPPP